MEQNKFSDSNLDFYELFDIYARLNPTYSDSNNFKINIYENCNLFQDLATTFSVPSSNIRLSSFKNNYIIADTQTLELNKAFYDANPNLFTTVYHENKTYINNIDLFNIIESQFVNIQLICPSKIIIKINLHKDIVDKDGSGALKINMKEIEEYFYYSLDTLELDILQYVTGKHGTLDTSTYRAASDTDGGNGQDADVDSAGPAIFITDNDDPFSYFTLNIKTNDNVIGGFGASGGNGGNGHVNFVYLYSDTTHNDSLYSATDYVEGIYTRIPVNSEYKYTLQLVFHYSSLPTMDDGTSTPMIKKDLRTESGDIYFNNYIDEFKYVGWYNVTHNYNPTPFSAVSAGDYYYAEEITLRMAGTVGLSEPVEHSGTVESGTYKYEIKATHLVWRQTPSSSPSDGEEGSTATYSNNIENLFATQAGSPGTDNDGEGGTGGTEGKPGGIINITAATAANIHVEP